MLLSRLGKIITKDDRRNKLRKNLYDIEKTQKLTNAKKKGFLVILLN